MDTIDASKWLADYEKDIPLNICSSWKKDLVLAYDINNTYICERIWKFSKKLLVIGAKDFFNSWKKKIEIDKLCGKKDSLPTLVICNNIKNAIEELDNTGESSNIVCLAISGKQDEFCQKFADAWGKKNMKKNFDLIIGNPPYNIGKDTGVDRRIHRTLENVTDGRIVFVHPSGYLLNHKHNVKPRESIDSSKLESIHLFWGNSVFNIKSYTPLCVSVWNKSKTDDIVSVIDDAYTYSEYKCSSDKIHIYGARKFEEFLNWLNSNVDYSVAISSKAVKKGREVSLPYAFEISTNRGTPANGSKTKFEDDFFTIIPKENGALQSHFVKGKGRVAKNNNVFEFNTENERLNFINYLKTKTVRFLLSLSKYDKNLLYGELNRIPWMDFNRSYSDKYLRKIWNIDDKMWEFIDSHIPTYYPDWHYDGIYSDDDDKGNK